jgi:hypothetical protein
MNKISAHVDKELKGKKTMNLLSKNSNRLLYENAFHVHEQDFFKYISFCWKDIIG